MKGCSYYLWIGCIIKNVKRGSKGDKHSFLGTMEPVLNQMPIRNPESYNFNKLN